MRVTTRRRPSASKRWPSTSQRSLICPGFFWIIPPGCESATSPGSAGHCRAAGDAPWFSASAVAPTLAHVWQLSPVTTAWLTMSVQLGFVGGALVSAILTLADRLSARRLVAGSAALAALATLGVAAAGGIRLGIACRLLTGAALAGVYPPGMKIAAGWFKEGRGLAIGILVGALTLGSASPHLVRWAVSPTAWRIVLVIAAVCALAGGLFGLLVPNHGPLPSPPPPLFLSAAPP